MIKRVMDFLSEFFYRPNGCVCELPPRAAARRHWVLDTDKCIVRRIK